MTKGRVEAFSDGVIAILITIMVLELKVPHEPTLESLKPLLPIFMGYTLSFVYLGIYWNNHHHMFQAAKHVNGTVLWANLHILFWISLVPVATTWVGENPADPLPTAIYGVLLVIVAIAYMILQTCLVRAQGDDKTMRRAFGSDLKGKLSPLVYVAGIGGSFIRPWIGQALYALVALIWLVPDPRIERELIRRKPDIS